MALLTPQGVVRAAPTTLTGQAHDLSGVALVTVEVQALPGGTSAPAAAPVDPAKAMNDAQQTVLSRVLKR